MMPRCRKGWPPVAKLLFSEQFLGDAATISSPRASERLHRILRMLERFPESGSASVPPSIARQFGPNIRKCAMNPFDLVYRYDPENDTVFLEGIVNQKMAY